jgi:hypothetical protein
MRMLYSKLRRPSGVARLSLRAGDNWIGAFASREVSGIFRLRLFLLASLPQQLRHEKRPL